MISAMNTDNLSCTFCFRNMINMLLPSTARQGTLLWTKGYPIDKGLSYGQRAILWTKGTSPLQIYLPKVIFSGIILIGMYFFTYNANFTK